MVLALTPPRPLPQRNRSIYYETIQDIQETDELLLGPREPLQLDVFGEGTNSDEKEIETGKRKGVCVR
ncbi:hypothetical protein Phum_PHUM496050 [Pediculus humanus corporis]|uniref:Uncharacterized protein n=1 Tax=Pediculus humanus subsp. corporis TaxID=121224 RepID=E0VX71_PEDHC|nr:uncharacterized protein Phum_PHUM496050 [Pediculus humanus corporis]EEB17977.1 hypothetical protein Phum_PHUM496050 [Pediculus humanus corporis]